jgi:hypothetical protein
MKAVSPVMPGSGPIELILAKNQEQYTALPVVYTADNAALPMVSRWRLSDEEREAITNGGDIILTQLTFRNPFQPVHLQVCGPDEMPVIITE